MRGPALPTDVLAELRGVVGAAHVLTDAGRRLGYERDWTGRFSGRTPAVLRPADVDEVAAVLACCHEAGVAVVPQGGNTGLVGGGVPLRGEVVLSLTRLDQLGPVDPLAAQVTAGAGVTLARLDAHARSSGLAYAVDLAARDSATVGGTVATNAGGLHVVRHGATRRQLLGVEAVLADGRVVSHLAGLEKDNTGYDLAGLLCGSEGTLAVVTAARLRLVPRPAASVAALCTFATVHDAVAAASDWRRRMPALSAVEFFLEDGMSLVCDQLGLARPLAAAPVYVVVEVADRVDPTEELLAAVGATAGLLDAVVAGDERHRRELWRFREEQTTAINRLGAPHKLDVTLPAGVLGDFPAVVREVVHAVAPEARVWLFGHLGDGNVHVNVTGPAPDDDRVDDAVLRRVAALGGSISAEHGIGTAKRRWLHLTRSPEELAVFRALKDALDPRGILNPHVLVG